MTEDDVLEKMRQWIRAEIQKAKKPYADAFVLTSLAFCASKVASIEESEPVLRRLHDIARTLKRHSAYDVVTPKQALMRIRRALAP